MNPDALDWMQCRTFLAIWREGSLSGAARRLGLAHPTVRRHLEDLERALGAPLFARSSTGLVPTALAQDVEPLAAAMESAAAALTRRASAEAGDAAGTVRLTASEIIGIEVLPPILSAIRQRHPGIAFELVLTNTVQDILRRDADIAVRMTRPAQSDLIARRVGSVALGMFAHRGWIDRHGLPADFADLALSRCLIGADRDLPAQIDALAAQGLTVTPAMFAFRSDSDPAQLAAIRAGIGVGICQAGIAAREPALVRVLPQLALSLEIWIAMLPAARVLARIRTVADALAEGLAAHAR